MISYSKKRVANAFQKVEIIRPIQVSPYTVLLMGVWWENPIRNEGSNLRSFQGCSPFSPRQVTSPTTSAPSCTMISFPRQSWASQHSLDRHGRGHASLSEEETELTVQKRREAPCRERLFLQFTLAAAFCDHCNGSAQKDVPIQTYSSIMRRHGTSVHMFLEIQFGS